MFLVGECKRETDNSMHMGVDEFIEIMLRIHLANSSRKWKSTNLSTFVQYVEDFRFYSMLLGALITFLLMKWQKCLPKDKN